jgi:hypothetical protein
MRYQNFYISQNAAFSKDIAVRNPDGTVRNLTGFTGSMNIAKHFDSVTKYPVTVAVQDAITGILRISLTAAQTDAIPYGNMVYTLFIQPPAGENEVLMEGEVVINPTV